jgi:hypothetical protein
VSSFSFTARIALLVIDTRLASSTLNFSSAFGFVVPLPSYPAHPFRASSHNVQILMPFSTSNHHMDRFDNDLQRGQKTMQSLSFILFSMHSSALFLYFSFLSQCNISVPFVYLSFFVYTMLRDYCASPWQICTLMVGLPSSPFPLRVASNAFIESLKVY